MRADWIVRDEDSRPVGPKGHCTYCKEPIGSEHAWDCVVPSRSVKVRAVIEYDINVPRSWTKADIEFKLNESSWCADNMEQDLDDYLKKVGTDCLCGIVTFEYLAESPDQIDQAASSGSSICPSPAS